MDIFGVLSLEDNGGYSVHLLPNLLLDREDINTNNIAGSNNQKDKLFIRGNAISGTPMYKGISQFLNLEIKVGIRKKKIIINL